MKATTSLYKRTDSPSHSMFETPKYRVWVLMKSHTKMKTSRSVKYIRNVVKKRYLRIYDIIKKSRLLTHENICTFRSAVLLTINGRRETIAQI